MNNDLISREALKKAACVKFYTTPYYKHILDLIDNAPIVEYPFYQEAYQTGYEEGKNKRPQVDLISREALKEQIDDCKYFHSSFQKMTVAEFLTIAHDFIDNAPTVDTGDCENCVFRKFSAKFIDDMVKVMAKNGIESVEQLMEMLKGGDK